MAQDDRAIGLRAAAHRLFDVGLLHRVQLAQQGCQFGQFGRVQIDRAGLDELVRSVHPSGARIILHPPGQRDVGPEQRRRGGDELRQAHRLCRIGFAPAQGVADADQVDRLSLQRGGCGEQPLRLRLFPGLTGDEQAGDEDGRRDSQAPFGAVQHAARAGPVARLGQGTEPGEPQVRITRLRRTGRAIACRMARLIPAGPAQDGQGLVPIEPSGMPRHGLFQQGFRSGAVALAGHGKRPVAQDFQIGRIARLRLGKQGRCRLAQFIAGLGQALHQRGIVRSGSYSGREHRSRIEQALFAPQGYPVQQGDLRIGGTRPGQGGQQRDGQCRQPLPQCLPDQIQQSRPPRRIGQLRTGLGPLRKLLGNLALLWVHGLPLAPKQKGDNRSCPPLPAAGRSSRMLSA